MKYRYPFQSSNNAANRYMLVFCVNGGKHMHFLTDVQVLRLHKSAELNCGIEVFPHAKSVSLKVNGGPAKFNIDIYINPTGCEIFVIESVLTAIAHEENLQPCNTTGY